MGLPRTQSSLLSIPLRELLSLNSSDPASLLVERERGPPSPSGCADVATKPHRRSSRSLSRVPEACAARPGHVWVDCYFYGFFIEEAKLGSALSSARTSASDIATAAR
mmetsp:Transcript_28009/g.89050  ORF Transcript_28009/g.89050 Transcript_28009/m.89050 type:complete len:108 (-) Transcript_28009:279-602(-)